MIVSSIDKTKLALVSSRNKTKLCLLSKTQDKALPAAFGTQSYIHERSGNKPTSSELRRSRLELVSSGDFGPIGWL